MTLRTMKVYVKVLFWGAVFQVSTCLEDSMASLPVAFKMCQLGDDVCLASAVTAAVKLIDKGLPSIGAVSLNPLHVTEIVMDRSTGPVAIRLVFKELDISGLTNVDFQNVKSDLGDKNFLLELKMKFPFLMMDGDYTIKGSILVLPIQGNGKANLTFDDVDCSVEIRGHVVSKESVDFVSIDDVILKFTTTRLYIYLENLFNGDKRLSDGMNTFLNENWRIILREIKPLAEVGLGQALKKVVTDIYDTVAYRKMHPK